VYRFKPIFHRGVNPAFACAGSGRAAAELIPGQVKLPKSTRRIWCQQGSRRVARYLNRRRSLGSRPWFNRARLAQERGGRDAALRRSRAVQARNWRFSEQWISDLGHGVFRRWTRRGRRSARHPYLCFAAPGRNGWNM